MWREILARANSIARDEPRDHKPLDNTGRVWEQSYIGLLSKGQKFIPAPKKVDTVAKFKDFEQFARKLRLKLYFAARRSEDFDREKEPWKHKSEFSPCPGESEALEKFLTELQIFLFNPENRNKFRDNLSADEREALKDLQKWNKDPGNPRVIRVQDKGSRFVIDWKKRYISKTLDYLQDSETFIGMEVDPSEAIGERAQS